MRKIAICLVLIGGCGSSPPASISATVQQRRDFVALVLKRAFTPSEQESVVTLADRGGSFTRPPVTWRLNRPAQQQAEFLELVAEDPSASLAEAQWILRTAWVDARDVYPSIWAAGDDLIGEVLANEPKPFGTSQVKQGDFEMGVVDGRLSGAPRPHWILSLKWRRPTPESGQSNDQ